MITCDFQKVSGTHRLNALLREEKVRETERERMNAKHQEMNLSNTLKTLISRASPIKESRNEIY